MCVSCKLVEFYVTASDVIFILYCAKPVGKERLFTIISTCIGITLTKKKNKKTMLVDEIIDT